jgi:hypothetical protein
VSFRGRARTLRLSFTIEGSTPVDTSFDEFVRINGLRDADAEAIARKLVEDGAFNGGGGVQSHYTLTVTKPARAGA